MSDYWGKAVPKLIKARYCRLIGERVQLEEA